MLHINTTWVNECSEGYNVTCEPLPTWHAPDALILYWLPGQKKLSNQHFYVYDTYEDRKGWKLICYVNRADIDRVAAKKRHVPHPVINIVP